MRRRTLQDRRFGRLSGALGITFVYMIAEAVGGWYTNSLALIADAGHMQQGHRLLLFYLVPVSVIEIIPVLDLLRMDRGVDE